MSSITRQKYTHLSSLCILTFLVTLLIVAACASTTCADTDIGTGLYEDHTANWSDNYYTTASSGSTATLTFNLKNGPLTYSGFISESTGKAKIALTVETQCGTNVTITQAQQYSGVTTIQNNADIKLAASGTLGSSNVVLSHGNLWFEGTGYGVGANAFTGNISTNTDNAVFYSSDTTTEISGKMSGNLKIVVSLGTLKLSNTANDCTGYVDVGTENSAGTLDLAAKNAIANAQYVEMSHTDSKITISSGDQTVKNLFGSGSVTTLAGATLTLKNTDNDTNHNTYSGTITGKGSVDVVVDSGLTYTLSGANTYSGTTTISGAGMLSLKAANAVSALSPQVDLSGNVTINAAGKGLYDEINNTCTASFTASNQQFNNLTGAGNITLLKEWKYYKYHQGFIFPTTDEISKEDFNEYWKNYNGGQEFNPADHESPFTLTLNNAAMGDITGEAINTTYSGVISGDANVVKTGAGTLTLTGANSYTGTTISAGTLKLTDTGTLGTGTTSIETNGTLEVSVSDSQTKKMSFTSTNAVSGAGNLVKSGNGTLQIDAATGSFGAGTFTLSAGRLDMKGAYTGILTLNGGTTFSPGNSTGTATITGSTNILENAKLLFEITSASTYDVLNAGDLTVDALEFVTLNVQGEDYTDGTELPIATYDSLKGTSTDVDKWLDKNTSTENWSLTTKDKTVYAKYSKSSPVPEPTTWALLILGSFGLLWLKKRK